MGDPLRAPPATIGSYRKWKLDLYPIPFRVDAAGRGRRSNDEACIRYIRVGRTHAPTARSKIEIARIARLAAWYDRTDDALRYSARSVLEFIGDLFRFVEVFKRYDDAPRCARQTCC